jgi:hypothetical protein
VYNRDRENYILGVKHMTTTTTTRRKMVERVINLDDITERREKNDWRWGLKWLGNYLSTEYGWSVEYSGKRDSFIDPVKKLVHLSTRHNDETVYYFFLHELGHIRIIKDNILWEKHFEKIFDERSKISLTYKVCTVEEEIMAWNIGYDIATTEKNGLPMRRKRYEELKARAVSTYMEWSLRRKLKSSSVVGE